MAWKINRRNVCRPAGRGIPAKLLRSRRSAAALARPRVAEEDDEKVTRTLLTRNEINYL